MAIVNNTIYMRTFNDQFFQFCDDIYRVFPDEVTIPQAKNLALMVKKTNPKLLISIWQRYVTLPYEEVMLNGSVDDCEAFFVSKDYRHDVRNLGSNAELTLKTLDMMRDRVKEMQVYDKSTAIKYVTNLIKLSNLYWNSGEKHIYYS